jgi:hypothetical protein
MERTMQQLEAGVKSMCAAGLSNEQIIQLARLKHLIAMHERSDDTVDFKRLAFAKYLYETGKIHG